MNEAVLLYNLAELFAGRSTKMIFGSACGPTRTAPKHRRQDHNGLSQNGLSVFLAMLQRRIRIRHHLRALVTH